MNEKLIRNIEYCSIERAARLLECEIEDIEHFLAVGAIGAYVFMLGQESSSDLILGTEFLNNGGEHIGNYLEEIISTEMSYANVKYVDYTPLNQTCNLTVYLEGLWRIVDLSTTVSLLNGMEDNQARLRPALRNGELVYVQTTSDLNTDTVFVYGFNVTNLEKSCIRILRADLLKLHEALHGEKGELSNVHNNDVLQKNVMQEKQGKQRSLRVDALPSHAFMTMVKAASINSDCSLAELSRNIDNYLNKSGCDALNLHERTLSNWKNKAKERSER